jgi:hypothetical protein
MNGFDFAISGLRLDISASLYPASIAICSHGSGLVLEPIAF